MPDENATACLDCYVPPCVRMLITCNPVTGEERDYFMWAEDVRVVCNESAPFDVCDEPEYCIPTTLACDQEPNRCARTLARGALHDAPARAYLRPLTTLDLTRT